MVTGFMLTLKDRLLQYTTHMIKRETYFTLHFCDLYISFSFAVRKFRLEHLTRWRLPFLHLHHFQSQILHLKPKTESNVCMFHVRSYSNEKMHI